MQELCDVLLIIDLQQGVCLGNQTIYNLPSIIERVNQRIESYHQFSKKIIFVQHCDEELVIDSDSWQIIPQLS